MDRPLLLDLYRQGMRPPSSPRRLWVTRCFEVMVRPGALVIVDEYEGYAVDGDTTLPRGPMRGIRDSVLYHRGRSVLDLKTGHMTEHPGTRQPRGR